MEKLEEYDRNGVPNIWVIDPRLRKMSIYTTGDLHEVRTAVIATTGQEISLTCDEIFQD
jgi:Uma2 family endonuclease